MLAEGPARLEYVDRLLAVDQAVCLRRRRRAKATRPPHAATKPGKPAPTIGPGTASPEDIPTVALSEEATNESRVRVVPGGD